MEKPKRVLHETPKKVLERCSHGFSYNFFVRGNFSYNLYVGTLLLAQFFSRTCASTRILYTSCACVCTMITMYKLCMRLYHDHHVQVVRAHAHKIHAHAIVQENKSCAKSSVPTIKLYEKQSRTKSCTKAMRALF